MALHSRPERRDFLGSDESRWRTGVPLYGSVRYNSRIATHLFSVALLAGLLPAQEKPKTVEALRKENAALRQQVKTLRAQLDAKMSKASEKVMKIVRIAEGKSFKAAGGRLDLLIEPGKEVSYYRLSWLEGKAHSSLDDEYRKSLAALTQAKRKLDGVKSPSKARVVVDEIECALLDVRRALWKLEQAEKKKAKDHKQSPSSLR